MDTFEEVAEGSVDRDAVVAVEHPPASGDGGGGPAAAAGGAPWQPGRVRKGPALIVLSIVAVVFGLGVGLAVVGGHAPRAANPSGAAVSGTGLSPSASKPLFAPIASGGDPPTDILNALVVPAGAVARSHEVADAGIDLYDGTVTLDVAAKPADVLHFYETELKRSGWQLSGPDATANGKELFGTHGSSDGFYWEVGVVVTAANPSLAPALNGDTPAGASTLALTLFQRDDAD